MSKMKKLYNLRLNISIDAERIKYLIKNAIYKPDTELETTVLGEMAMELANRIRKNSEKIGMILEH